jgi:hypothetical protein
MGAPGKTPKNKRVLPKLKKGELTEYGYHLKNSSEKRERSLRKAMKNEGDLTVLRRVVVLRTYMKANPTYYKKLNKDVEFIQGVRAKNKLKGGARKVVRRRTTKTSKSKPRRSRTSRTSRNVKRKTDKPKSALKKRRSSVNKKVKQVRFTLYTRKD